MLALLLSPHASAAPTVNFEADVRPIFREHCAGCHNQDDAASDFAADSFDAVLAGGAGGEVLAAGDPDGSRLWRLVSHKEEPSMPPGGDKLPDDQLALIRAWIQGGLIKAKGGKPLTPKRAAIAAVDVASLGKPVGDPAMPEGWFREPMVTAETTGPINSLAASPWAPLVAVPWQRQVAVYHTDSHQLLGITPYLEGVPQVVRFSRDGTLLLVAGGRDGALGSAAVIDVVSGARLATIGDELDTVLAADISPDSRLVAIGGPKKKVRVYQVADGSLAYTCEKHTDWVTAVAFSPDGELLATGDRSAGLRLWQAASGLERSDLRGHTAAITAIDWRPGGGLLASASDDGTVRLWNPDGSQAKSISAHAGGVNSVRFFHDGRLATAGRDRLAKLWSPDGGHVADLAKCDDLALAAAPSHDGASAAVSDWTGAVRLIKVEGGDELARLSPNPPTLHERLTTAETRVAEAQSQRDAKQAAADQATEALAAGRRAHEAFEKRVAAARQALAKVDQVAQQSAAVLKGRSEAVATAQRTRDEAKAVLAEARGKLEAAEKSGAPSVELVTATAGADSEFHAAEAALGEASRIRIEAEAAASASASDRDDAAERLGQVESQRAGLPDLAALESDQAARRAELTSAEGDLVAALAARDASAAESERYTLASAALAEGAASAEAAAAEATAATERAAALASDADAQAAALSEAVAKLSEELEALRAKLRTVKTDRAASQRKADEVAAELASQQERQLEAERAAQVARARADDLEAAIEWRRSRAETE